MVIKTVSEKQNIEHLLKRNVFFLVNSRYGFISTLINIWLVLLDLVEYSKTKIFSLVVNVEKLTRIFFTKLSSGY